MRSAPVTSLSSAQRPVSSSASSQAASCAGSSDFPSEASVVTTCDRVGVFAWFVVAADAVRSPPPTRAARGGEGAGVGGSSASAETGEFAARPPPPPPPPPPPGGGGGGNRTPRGRPPQRHRSPQRAPQGPRHTQQTP